MATKAKLVATPVVYEIGTDLSAEAFEKLVLAIGDWYAESRPACRQPNVLARQHLLACLRCVKPSDDSQVWKGAQTTSLAGRVRVACGWDMVKMSPLRSGSAKQLRKRQLEKARVAKNRLAKMDDLNVPDEIRTALAKEAKYGDDVRTQLNANEHRNWQAYKDAYVAQFPELGSINGQAELDSLCDLHIMHERLRLRMLKNEAVSTSEFTKSIDTISNAKKALGIHPDQVAKRVTSTTNGSVAEAVTRMETLPNWKDLREKYSVEELLLVFQQFHTPSPRSDTGGWQTDEVGLYGVTKCMTCVCSNPGCGTRNFRGLNVAEIEDHLLKKGVIEPVSE